jgi:hypothetical protein
MRRIAVRPPNLRSRGRVGRCRAKAASTLPRSRRSCRAYANNFYEAVVTRQAASLCEDGVSRQRDLEMLDAAIDAINNMIAAECAGS